MYEVGLAGRAARVARLPVDRVVAVVGRVDPDQGRAVAVRLGRPGRRVAVVDVVDPVGGHVTVRGRHAAALRGCRSGRCRPCRRRC